MMATNSLLARSRHWRSFAQNRHGSIMILVLVLLGIIAMLTVQSMKLLVATSQADRSQVRSAQIQELLLFGQARLKQQLAKNADYAGEDIQLHVLGEPQASDANTANISVKRLPLELPASPPSTKLWQIRVTYPVGTTQETSIIWESR